MNRPRLKQLLEVLDEIPPARFDMTSWGERRLTGCETVYCVAGWHAELRPQCGLRMEPSASGATLTLVFGQWQGITAAAEFYGLHTLKAEHLFCTSSYPRGSLTTIAEVKERIENFLQEN